MFFKHLDKGWKMMIYILLYYLANTGARWFTEGKKPLHLRKKALDFVRILMDAPIDYICIENPVSVISSHIREADQMIQPYEFGHKEYKKTCLWLKNLPLLKQTNNVYEETKILPVKEKSKTWWMGDGKANRDVISKNRSKFFTGIASAMADQWGDENKLPVAVEQLSILIMRYILDVSGRDLKLLRASIVNFQRSLEMSDQAEFDGLIDELDDCFLQLQDKRKNSLKIKL